MFIDAHSERVHCIFLDNELKLINSEKICSGDFGKVTISIRSLYQRIFESKSNRIVISHNHPFGSCIPSYQDVNATKVLYDDLKKIDVELVDHVIVGSNGVWSMRKQENPDIWK